jgi:hypothetical protein
MVWMLGFCILGSGVASAQEDEASALGKGRQDTFVLSVQAVVDGSDELYLDVSGAQWSHKHWGWPSQMSLNGVLWDPALSNQLPNSGDTAFLPANVDFSRAQINVLQGRDTVAMERDANSLVVYLADTPNGADTYSFEIAFPLHRSRKPSGSKGTRTTLLQISAVIDGSDVLYITKKGAVWTHKHWGWPGEVTLNGIGWNPSVSSIIANSAGSRFLDRRVKFSSARVLVREGRDTVAVMPQKDGLLIFFADNPIGSGVYNLTIEFNR